MYFLFLIIHPKILLVKSSIVILLVQNGIRLFTSHTAGGLWWAGGGKWFGFIAPAHWLGLSGPKILMMVVTLSAMGTDGQAGV